MSTTTINLPPDVLRSIVETWQNMVASSYTSAAAVTAYLYDILLTFSDEKELIWKRKMTFVSVLYLINRYLSLPVLLMYNYHISLLRGKVSNDCLHFSSCRGNVIVYAITWGICLTASTWLLSLRVISLWHSRKWVVWSIYFVFGACHLSEWVITAYSLSQMYSSISYFGGVKVCGADSVELLGVAYFIIVGLEAYVLSLQLIHHYCNMRMRRRYNLQTFTLVKTLYKDGYAYFIIAVSFRLLTCLVWALGPGSLWYLTNEMEFAMTVTLASRFHLHLKRAAVGPSPTHQSDYPMITSDAITQPNDARKRSPNTTFSTATFDKNTHNAPLPLNFHIQESNLLPNRDEDKVHAITSQPSDSGAPLTSDSHGMSWLGLARTRSSKELGVIDEGHYDSERGGVDVAPNPTQFLSNYGKDVDQLEMTDRRPRRRDLEKQTGL